MKLLFYKNYKKIGAAIVSAFTLITSPGTIYAMPIVNSNLQLSTISSNMSSIEASSNIDLGSFQNNIGSINMTSSKDTFDNEVNNVSKFGIIKTKTVNTSMNLGVNILRETKKSSEKERFFSAVDTAFAATVGRRSPYGSVGCAETVTYAGSYYSPALKDAFNRGIAYVPSLVSVLSAKGYEVEPFNGYAEKGDLLIYGGDDHVVIADGAGGCFGNSSSRLQAMHYSDVASAWNYGELPSKIIHMYSCSE